MNAAETSLLRAVSCYRALRDFLDRVEALSDRELHGGGPDELGRALERLQADIVEADRILLTALADAPVSRYHPLVGQLQALMEEIPVRTVRIVPRLESLRDLVGAELHQLHDSRCALGCYHSGRRNKGGVVRNAI